MIRRELGYVPNNGKCQGVGCSETAPRNISTATKHNHDAWHVCYDAYDKNKDIILCPKCYFKTKVKKE